MKLSPRYIIPAAIALLAVVVGAGIYWHVHTTPYYVGYTLISDHPLGGPDSEGCYWSKDGQVYFRSGENFSVVEGADAATFKDRSHFSFCVGADAHYAYQGTKRLTGFDPSVFKILWWTPSPEGPRIFVQHDANSISAFLYQKDDTTLGAYQVSGGDPASFETIAGAFDLPKWAKDKRNIYCRGTDIYGADPSTATTTSKGLLLAFSRNGVPSLVDSICDITPIISPSGMFTTTLGVLDTGQMGLFVSKDGRTINTIDFGKDPVQAPGAESLSENKFVSFEDVNFDGIEDLLIAMGRGSNRNATYLNIYLYDKTAGTFVLSHALSNISTDGTLIPDAATKELIIRATSSSCDIFTDIYVVHGLENVEHVSHESQTCTHPLP
jgi:hypothetical protein